MTEPEILETLARLEEEEPPFEANPELPLPASGGADYLLILRDLQNALGDAGVEPENSFADAQNILEIDVPTAKAETDENDLDLLSETTSDYADFETPIEPNSMTEMPEVEMPENLPEFFDSVADFSVAQPEQDFDEEADCLPLADFLPTHQFNPATETNSDEQAIDSVFEAKDFVPEDYFFDQLESSFSNFHAERFSSEPDFEENQSSESVTNFDSSTELTPEPTEANFEDPQNQTEFDFVRNEEKNEFPEILTDEERIDEFQTEDSVEAFAAEETIAAAQDYADSLPAAQRAILSEFDEPPFPRLESPETAFEILPEPSFAAETEETNEMRSQFVVFKLDDERFAFPSTSIVEIGYQPELSALPFVPAWFSGIANLRGDVIAVLDLRGLWDKPCAAPNARQKMLIVRSEKENLTVGLLVDAVSEMRNLTLREINAAKDFAGADSASQPFAFCLQGISRTSDSVLHLLDAEQLLTSPKLRQL
jgi:purine-binding chemotaxis protein CheW